MAGTGIDSQINKIHDTVTGIRLDFVELKAEQKAANKAVDTLCETINRYSKGTEKRLSTIEENLGNKIPDDPDAFSQIQTLQGFRKRSAIGLKMIWGLLSGAILMLFNEVFGWFHKGH